VSVGFTLVGAYRHDTRPLDFRRLEVKVYFRPPSLALGMARLDGFVHAEGISESAHAVGEVRLSRFRILYRFDFASDDGYGVALEFSHDLPRLTVRALTELEGQLTRIDDGSVLGRARLRFDVRRVILL
jgi:hypothetical protein